MLNTLARILVYICAAIKPNAYERKEAASAA
jgi:hypothetical protein